MRPSGPQSALSWGRGNKKRSRYISGSSKIFVNKNSPGVRPGRFCILDGVSRGREVLPLVATQW